MFGNNGGFGSTKGVSGGKKHASKKIDVKRKCGPTTAQIWNSSGIATRSELAYKSIQGRCPEERVKLGSECAQLDAHSLKQKYPCIWKYISERIKNMALKTG